MVYYLRDLMAVFVLIIKPLSLSFFAPPHIFHLLLHKMLILSPLSA